MQVLTSSLILRSQNVIFNFKDGKKIATAIECKVKDVEQGILLTENDYVFVTNGSCTEGTIYGDQNHAPNGDAEVRTSGVWSLWKNIAAQDPSFGHPESSAQTFPEQTGNPLLSPLWMTVLSLISPISASVTHVPARLLPVVS